MDETHKQLIGEVREPLPVALGQPERVEHEYLRNIAQIFLEVEPLTGRCHVEATERRTRQVGPVDRGHVGEAIPGGRAGGPGLGQPRTESNRCTRPTSLDTLANWHNDWTPLHAEARQLAQHCRNRIERAVRTMPGPPDSKPAT